MIPRPIAVLILVALAVALLALMWWGWRARARRQDGLGPGPGALEAPATLSIEGTYVSSTMADQWLERVVVDDLGTRSEVRADIAPDGITLRRRAAKDVVIPAADLAGARTGSGIAGKVVGGNGLVLIRWRRGDLDLDTGIRTRYRSDRDRLVAATNSLAQRADSGSDTKDQV